MEISHLNPFFDKEVVLVVNGHVMYGVLRKSSTQHDVVTLDPVGIDKDLYTPATVDIEHISAVRGYLTKAQS